MTRRLILLRHGQTEYNATSRMQGQLDTELSELGIRQAEDAAKVLAGQNIVHVISSDLTRAHKTALAVAGLIDTEVTQDRRLRETHLGEWQAKTHQEIDNTYPGARAKWRHDPQWAPPGGESRLDVARRSRQLVDDLMINLPEWNNGTVLLVAHGGTINALTSNLLDLDLDQYPMFSGLGNTRSSQLTARPRYQAGGLDADGEREPVTPAARFSPETIGDAQWYLDAWNTGA